MTNSPGADMEVCNVSLYLLFDRHREGQLQGKESWVNSSDGIRIIETFRETFIEECMRK
jgi:hypothetical protein